MGAGTRWAVLGLLILRVCTASVTITRTSTHRPITAHMQTIALALAPTVSNLWVKGFITVVRTVTISIAHIVRRNTEIRESRTWSMVRLVTVHTVEL